LADQADPRVTARRAAEAVGATPMDRPEWPAVNPAPGEDRKMSDQDWILAANIWEAQIPDYMKQKRVIVLHSKRGRAHAHVVWERFDHEKGIMISNSFDRLAQDRARKEMERVFEHKRTPDRNLNRDAIKSRLTALWHATKTTQEFIRLAADYGLYICKGTQRPFMVVNETGRSFDLVRQLEGIKTKEVNERLQDSPLQSDKHVIRSVRVLQDMAAFERKQKRLADMLSTQKAGQKIPKGFTGFMKDMKAGGTEITQGANPNKQKTAALFAETKGTIEGGNSKSGRQQKIEAFRRQFSRHESERQHDVEPEP